MNLIREIKQYQAPDGTCFNTKEEAEEYAELLKNPQFIKTQERLLNEYQLLGNWIYMEDMINTARKVKERFKPKGD